MPSYDKGPTFAKRWQVWATGYVGHRRVAKEQGFVFESASKGGQSWQEFFELLKRLEIPKGFLGDRDDTPPQEREGLRSLADEIDRSG